MSPKILALLLAGAATVDSSQAATDDDFDPARSFASFRQNLLKDYSSFQEGILKDYGNFLEQAWVEFDTHKGEDRYSSPKPKETPQSPPHKSTLPIAFDTVTVTPSQTYAFDFFGIPIEVADLTLNLNQRLNTPADYGRFWRDMTNDANASALVSELLRASRRMRLNDYLTYELVASYIRERCDETHSSIQTALAHFILANMGYGVRVAVDETGAGMLLLPFDRKVYGRPYLTIDGTVYHVFLNDGSFPDSNVRITTCPLPAGADTGAPLSLKLTPLNIPVRPKHFSIAHDNITLAGEVNENLFPIIYRYPQMDIREYATTILDPDLCSSLVEQIKIQLASKPQLEAINELLQFTQSAFDYATDDAAHGFEKPYFLEEILFYPQSDCEDRVIFYTYMLWNVLGVENQLITYPQHESAAVRLDQLIEGDSYDYNGTRFYISDPTYVGSITGQCMPQFRNHSTQLEYHYRK